MAYRSPLEARLAKKATKAITQYGLIEDGDRVMVGLSGGKDSWALLQILDVLRQRAPIDFSLVAVNVDSGYKGYKHDVIAETCRARGWELRIEHTTIGEVMDDILDAGDTPCSLCARLAAACSIGSPPKSGRPRSRSAITSTTSSKRSCSIPVLRRRAQGDAGAAGLRRRQARGDSAAGLRAGGRRPRLHPGVGLPVIGCCCPACGDLSLQRQRIKRLIMDLEREHRTSRRRC